MLYPYILILRILLQKVSNDVQSILEFLLDVKGYSPIRKVVWRQKWEYTTLTLISNEKQDLEWTEAQEDNAQCIGAVE